jgi:Nitrile hydratase, alpha chain
MTEAAAGGRRAEIERKIIQRSLEDEDFRQTLLEDPRGTVEQELGTRLQEGVQIRAVEETAETIYLVLPSASPVEAGVEFSEQDLKAVAGGQVITWGTTYDAACGY